MVLSSNSLRKKNVQAKNNDYIYFACGYTTKRTKLGTTPIRNGSYTEFGRDLQGTYGYFTPLLSRASEYFAAFARCSLYVLAKL